MGSTRPFGRFVGDVGLGAFGLTLGAVCFLLFQATFGGAAVEGPVDAAVVIEAPDAAGAGAVSPLEAVAGFLGAETAQDAPGAFALLSEADRLDHRSPQIWATRASIGQVHAWEWLDADSLVTSVSLAPSLSLTTGWSPASATISWQVVEEDGWRVSLIATVMVPSIPDPTGAVAATRRWLIDPARCDATADARLVLAPPSSAYERLCSSGGVMASAVASPVTGRAAAHLSLAYGADVSTWARTVPLEGGLDLVLVAFDDRWLVIDAATS